MRYLWMLLLVVAFNANADFVTGMVVGSALSSGSSKPAGSVTIDLTKPTLVCRIHEVNSRTCAEVGRRSTFGVFVKDNGYNFYRKKQMLIVGEKIYIVMEVWK
jgi:hypothetical protein